ncbi:MAG: tRNA (guanosine(37)-N1)-methyltransferase TrmD [Christensenellales bacterium]
MKIDILSLFPEMFMPLKTSLIQRAVSNNILEINIINIRDYSKDKHKKCDDYPFGGGAGLVMTPQPICDSIKSIPNYKSAKKIYMSPRGRKIDQKLIEEFSRLDHLIILCGHYEGVDQRVIDNYIDEEVSLGDFVVTGGEIPAMALVDAVSRYIDGVIGNKESLKEESFASGKLEYPQYTHPREFEGHFVPDVLLTGNHGAIEKWRAEKSQEITEKRRPDLLK